jgi:SOS response regulatory protein OraA/RecX
MKTPRIIVWVLIAYCVFVLVIGITRVDAVTPIPTCSTGPDRAASGHGPSPRAIIDRLEHKGVDVAEVRAALQKGDTEAVKAWLEVYRQAHPEGNIHRPGAMNPEKAIERLEQKGVDVTEVKAAVQKGDTDAVKAWLQSYFGTHKDEMPKRHMKGPVRAETAP